jgi:hypothetical protein
MVPPTVTGGDPGAGGINATAINIAGSPVVAQSALPACPDTSGKHLNYNSGTFTCGTTSSGGAGATLRSYLAGFQHTNDATDSSALDIGPGQAADSTNASYLSFGFSSISTTCGSVANGATSCTVASATGILPGAQIQIAGAGNTGGTTPLITYVTAVSGTTVTWKDAAINTSTLTTPALTGTGSCVVDISTSGSAGALDTGSASGVAFYATFIISGTAGTSCIASKTVAATTPTPTLPSGYTSYRRVGAFRANGTAWTTMIQQGDHVWYSTTISDVSGTADLPSSSGTLFTISVPLGIKVRPIYRAQVDATHSLLISSPGAESDQVVNNNGQWGTTTPGFDIASASTVAVSPIVQTNTSGQIRARANSGTSGFWLMTRGYIDTKDREL